MICYLKLDVVVLAEARCCAPEKQNGVDKNLHFIVITNSDGHSFSSGGEKRLFDLIFHRN